MQQFVILAKSDNEQTNGGMPPIGNRDEILKALYGLNTAPDKEGGDTLYGPGIVIELPPNEPVTQMLLSITEDDIAWLVIMEILRQCPWKIFDVETGRELSAD